MEQDTKRTLVHEHRDSVSRATRQVASATGSLPSSGTALNNGNEKGPATTQASGFRDTAHRAG